MIDGRSGPRARWWASRRGPNVRRRRPSGSAWSTGWTWSGPCSKSGQASPAACQPPAPPPDEPPPGRIEPSTKCTLVPTF